jgi:hypothetical protein
MFLVGGVGEGVVVVVGSVISPVAQVVGHQVLLQGNLGFFLQQDVHVIQTFAKIFDPFFKIFLRKLQKLFSLLLLLLSIKA